MLLHLPVLPRRKIGFWDLPQPPHMVQKILQAQGAWRPQELLKDLVEPRLLLEGHRTLGSLTVQDLSHRCTGNGVDACGPSTATEVEGIHEVIRLARRQAKALGHIGCILIQQLRFSVFKGAQCTEEGREVHKLCLGVLLPNGLPQGVFQCRIPLQSWIDRLEEICQLALRQASRTVQAILFETFFISFHLSGCETEIAPVDVAVHVPKVLEDLAILLKVQLLSQGRLLLQPTWVEGLISGAMVGRVLPVDGAPNGQLCVLVLAAEA
mmetsp:Transcript_70074/g.154492  ORF Transcript_70074/g.154492 Transcript_70074/m.154492 type:complete len:267 (+) Transcript_70074:49-849(+)